MRNRNKSILNFSNSDFTDLEVPLAIGLACTEVEGIASFPIPQQFAESIYYPGRTTTDTLLRGFPLAKKRIFSKRT